MISLDAGDDRNLFQVQTGASCVLLGKKLAFWLVCGCSQQKGGSPRLQRVRHAGSLSLTPASCRAEVSLQH